MENVKTGYNAYLESIVKNYIIFMDTCSLLNEHADEFWNDIVPILSVQNKHIIIPHRVCEEVYKHQFNKDKDHAFRKNAARTLENIKRLSAAGLVEIRGNKSDNYADNLFRSVFTKFYLRHNLMLITNDNNLATTIRQIPSAPCDYSKYKIQVRKINAYGKLDSKFRKSNKKANNKQYKKQVKASGGFRMANSVTTITGKLAMTLIPHEGSIVTSVKGEDRQQILLGKEKAKGGEGIVYSTNVPGYVAKIYKPAKLDRVKFEKLNRMLSKSISCKGVCFPVALLYNERNEFVGYLMKEARGHSLMQSVFIPQELKRIFPSWNRKDTVTLCITILKKIKYLHDRNIILGDINPNNILVVSPTEVYFVDADSYQIEEFPCPVGMANFTAPEIQGKPYSSFLRTFGNEYFAIATLLFMIMMPGKSPYAQQGGVGEAGKKIIEGDFSYPCEDQSNGKAPRGFWRFCWSHLPLELKKDFYKTFRKGGEYYSEADRLDTAGWLHEFKYYFRKLDNGTLQKYDEMSIQIFPDRLKKNPYKTYGVCQHCGKEVEVDRLYHGICKDCRDEVVMYQTCVECGEQFTITLGEKLFYDEKGMDYPKRCPNCRAHSRSASRSRSTSYSHSSPRSGSKSRSRTTNRSYSRQNTTPKLERVRVNQKPQPETMGQRFLKGLNRFFGV